MRGFNEQWSRGIDLSAGLTNSRAGVKRAILLSSRMREIEFFSSLDSAGTELRTFFPPLSIRPELLKVRSPRGEIVLRLLPKLERG